MRPDLIELLCCPDCKGNLIAEPSVCENSRILEGTLKCAKCGAGYPVVRGIPRFVPDDGYVKSFSYEWNKWSRVQLDSARGFRESEQTFVEKTGFLPQDLEGRTVLDVGCGSGRFLEVASRWGARAIGIDYSRAVEAARANLASNENVDILQADVFRLPFKKESFEIVFSIGVLHHTRDTREAFSQLPPLLKAGGEIAVWLYYYTDALHNKASDFWRAVFRHAPHRVTFAWSWLIAVLLWPFYRRPAFSRIPLGHIRRVLPISMHPDYHWRVLDTFDWYSPRFQDKNNSIPRVVRWFRDAGLRDIEILNPLTSVRGTRPGTKPLPQFRNPLTDIYSRRIVLFGAGSGGHLAFAQLEKLGLAGRVVAVCDNSPEKTGLDFQGHCVRRFEDLARDEYDVVIIASLPGLAPISAQLEKTGLVEFREFASMNYLSEYLFPSIAEAVHP